MQRHNDRRRPPLLIRPRPRPYLPARPAIDTSRRRQIVLQSTPEQQQRPAWSPGVTRRVPRWIGAQLKSLRGTLVAAAGRLQRPLLGLGLIISRLEWRTDRRGSAAVAGRAEEAHG